MNAKSLLCFNLVTLMAGFSFFAFVLLIPLFAHQLGLSLTATGFVLAVFSLAVITFSPLWGHLSDRWGRRKLFLTLGNLVFFASSLSHFYVHSLEGLVVARFIQGMAFATNPMLTALFSEHFGEEAARRFGSFSAANAVGWGLGSLVSGALADLVGIRWVFVLVSLLPLISAGLIHWGLPEKAPPPKANRPKDRVPSKLFYLYATIFTRHSGAIALWSVFPIYLRSFVGSLSLVGAVNAVNMLVQPLFMLLIGRYAGRWGELRLVGLGIAGSILTFLVYATAPGVGQIILGQVMIAAAWSAIFIGMNLYIMGEVPPRARGKAFGYLQSAMTSAAAVGPLIGGALSDALGIRGMIFTVSALMALSLPFLGRLRSLERKAYIERLGQEAASE